MESLVWEMGEHWQLLRESVKCQADQPLCAVEITASPTLLSFVDVDFDLAIRKFSPLEGLLVSAAGYVSLRALQTPRLLFAALQPLQLAGGTTWQTRPSVTRRKHHCACSAKCAKQIIKQTESKAICRGVCGQVVPLRLLVCFGLTCWLGSFPSPSPAAFFSSTEGPFLAAALLVFSLPLLLGRFACFLSRVGGGSGGTAGSAEEALSCTRMTEGDGKGKGDPSAMSTPDGALCKRVDGTHGRSTTLPIQRTQQSMT